MKKSIKITAGVAAGVLGLGIVGAAFSDGESEPVQTTDTTEVVEAKAEANAAPPQPEPKPEENAEASAKWDRNEISDWAETTGTIMRSASQTADRGGNCPTTSVEEFNACLQGIAAEMWRNADDLTAHVNDGMKINMPPACKKVVKQTGLIAKRMDQAGDATAGGIASVDQLVTASKRFVAATETGSKLTEACVEAIR